jgi:putative serine protease PepD
VRLTVSVAFAATAWVLALGFAGCGDSSEGTSTSNSTETSTTTEAQRPAVDASDLLGATIAAATAGEPGVVVQSSQSTTATVLRRGDVIVAVNGAAVANPDELAAAIGTPRLGRDLTLRVVRGSRRITLTEVPSPTAYLGANVRDSGGADHGAVVVSVAKDSPAAASDIRRGDLITAVGNTPVDSVDELLHAIATHAPGDTVTITVSRGSRKLHVTARLADRPN